MTFPVNYRKEAFLHGYGVAADRPADALPGTLYFSTDTFAFERFNGTTWDDYSIAGGLGIFDTVAFSAANFSAIAPMTWTVGGAAIANNKFAQIGTICYWAMYISWFSGSNVLSGSPAASLYITIPNGVSATSVQVQPLTFAAGITGVPMINGLYCFLSGTTMEIKKYDNSNFALADVPGIIFTVVFQGA